MKFTEKEDYDDFLELRCMYYHEEFARKEYIPTISNSDPNCLLQKKKKPVIEFDSLEEIDDLIRRLTEFREGYNKRHL